MQKVLIGVLLAAIILTIPSVYERVQVEESNKTVETMIPYKVIQDWLGEDSELALDQILSDLDGAGIETISLEPDNLRSLERKGVISAISAPRMREHILLNGLEPLEESYDKEGYFIYSDPEHPFEETAEELFEDSRSVTIADVDYTFIPGLQEDIFSVPTGYDPEVVEAVLNAGLNIVPRITDYAEPEQTERLAEELLSLKQEGIDKVLFLGDKLPFSSEPEQLKNFSSQLKEAGYSLLSIEQADQEGFTTAAYTMDMDVVRLHSQALTEDNAADIADKFVRAVKERNILALFMNISITEYDKALESLEQMQTLLDSDMPSAYSIGESEAFKSFEVPLWQTAIALLGSVAFLAWAADSVFNNRRLTYIALAGGILAALLYMVTGLGIILKAFALAVAVTAPVFAVLLKKNPNSKAYILASYFKAVGIALIGIWLVVVLLNGSPFILGIDQFRGVKLVYVLPMAFIALYAVWGNMEKILKANVIYWHLLVIGIAAVVGLFYMGRTGNAGIVIPYELEARMLLEQILYVRPRTKEFLIGFPLFVVALYMAKTHVRASYFLLVPGVIGFLSMVNTFTHFHIPLSISLLRTAYSVIFGLLIGLLLVFLYKWIGKRIVNQIKARWQF